ncbi:MAG: hypothetical protein ABI923_05290 [bacterium]
MPRALTLDVPDLIGRATTAHQAAEPREGSAGIWRAVAASVKLHGGSVASETWASCLWGLIAARRVSGYFAYGTFTAFLTLSETFPKFRRISQLLLAYPPSRNEQRQ